LEGGAFTFLIDGLTSRGSRSCTGRGDTRWTPFQICGQGWISTMSAASVF